jgi:DNA primase
MLHNYLVRHRGISEASYRWFGTRTVPGEPHVLALPFTNLLGNVVGLALRNVITKQVRSLAVEGWDVPKKGKMGSWYGLSTLRPNSPILIVESELCAMKAHTFGFTNVIAPGGVGITKAQAKAIPSGSQVLLGLDSDVAGRENTPHFRKRLGRGIRVRLVDWSPHKDVGDIETREEFWDKINAATP